MSDPKGKEKTNGKGKTDDPKGKDKAKGKGKNGKETRVCHECNKPGHLRKDCFVCKRRMAEKGGNKETTETTAAVQGATSAVQGAMVETWEYTEDDHVFAFGCCRDRCCSERKQRDNGNDSCSPRRDIGSARSNGRNVEVH